MKQQTKMEIHHKDNIISNGSMNSAKKCRRRGSCGVARRQAFFANVLVVVLLLAVSNVVDVVHNISIVAATGSTITSRRTSINTIITTTTSPIRRKHKPCFGGILISGVFKSFSSLSLKNSSSRIIAVAAGSTVSPRRFTTSFLPHQHYADADRKATPSPTSSSFSSLDHRRPQRLAAVIIPRGGSMGSGYNNNDDYYNGGYYNDDKKNTYTGGAGDVSSSGGDYYPNNNNYYGNDKNANKKGGYYDDFDDHGAREDDFGGRGGRYDGDVNNDDPTPLTTRISSMMPSMIKTGNRQIGVPLLAVGTALTVLGMSLFFNKTLMRLGNLFFVAGVPMTLGPGRTAGYFFQPKKARATACLGSGIVLVFIGWPILGLALEIFGLLNLFGNMFPFAMALLKQMPVIGPMLRGEFGSSGDGGGISPNGGRRRNDPYDDYQYDDDDGRRDPYDDGRYRSGRSSGGSSPNRYDDYGDDDFGRDTQRYY